MIIQSFPVFDICQVIFDFAKSPQKKEKKKIQYLSRRLVMEAANTTATSPLMGPLAPATPSTSWLPMASLACVSMTAKGDFI